MKPFIGLIFSWRNNYAIRLNEIMVRKSYRTKSPSLPSSSLQLLDIHRWIMMSSLAFEFFSLQNRLRFYDEQLTRIQFFGNFGVSSFHSRDRLLFSLSLLKLSFLIDGIRDSPFGGATWGIFRNFILRSPSCEPLAGLRKRKENNNTH